jgi:SAM-dependent methyltransferase
LAAIYAGLQDSQRVEDGEDRARAARLYVQRLGRYAGARRGALLDVGCSTGAFLTAAVQDGWEVTGIEPSAWLAAQARARSGAEVHECSFEDWPLPARPFDAITMWDVLEHVEDPRAVLAKAGRALRSGGILGLNVPNIASLPARCMGRRWPLILPEHTYYFTPASLARLLEETGFARRVRSAHPVRFRAGFVAERLCQHGVPGAGVLRRALAALGLHSASVPVLMGDMTVLASRKAA